VLHGEKDILMGLQTKTLLSQTKMLVMM
jgi:hypothetical protein